MSETAALREALSELVGALDWYAGKYGLGPAKLMVALEKGRRALEALLPPEAAHDGPCYEEGVLEGLEFAAKLVDRFNEEAELNLAPLAEEIRKLAEEIRKLICQVFQQKNMTSEAGAVRDKPLAFKDDYLPTPDLSHAKLLQLNKPLAQPDSMQKPILSPSATERIWCMECGKSVSSEVPKGTVVRAWVECPECIERKANANAGQ